MTRASDVANHSRYHIRNPRLAILAPHVVQYHAPIYREIAATEQVNMVVLYADRLGLKPCYINSMHAVIQWDVPLLDGYPYEFMSNLSSSPRLPFLGRVNPEILRRLLSRQYDVLLLQDYFFLTSWLALLAAKIVQMKILFRSEGTLKVNRGVRLGQVAARIFIEASDLVLYSCTGNRIWLEYCGATQDKVFLMPCSVDNDLFCAQHALILSRSKSPKEQLGLAEGVLYVISVARMHPGKRLLDIVEAIAMLQRMGVPVGLILVGDGPEHDQIKARICELELKHVHMPGFVNISQLGAYYAAADVFVLASQYDASPKALSEALVFGLPIICTDVVGTAPDLVLEGENGFLFPVGDVQKLVDCLQIVLTDPERRQAMGRRSFSLSEQWSAKAAAASVVQAVHRVTGCTKYVGNAQ